MKPFLAILIGANLLFATLSGAQIADSQNAPNGNEPSDLRILSEREAETIVRDTMEARERAADERLAELDNRPAVERTYADLGERRVLFNRVKPRPVVQRIEAAESQAERPQLTEAEINRLMEEWQVKDDVFIMLSGTIYDDRITELRWVHNGRSYLAYSNVNFNYLRGIGSFETEDAHYSFFMAMGEDSRESVVRRNRQARAEGWENHTPQWLPTMRDFSGRSPEYLVISDDPDVFADESAFAGLDALHLYYQENERELKIAYQRREALNAARKRYLQENPPKPRDTVINFAPSADSASLRNR